MTEKDLNMEWAWSQVEAMADGSLTGADRRRMRAAMRSDAALSTAVAEARRLRRELALLGPAPVPGALSRRLLAIPSRSHVRPTWSVIGVPIAAAAMGAVAAIAGLLALEQTSRPDFERELAVQELRLAMSYLQRSAVMTGNDVTRELTNGLREALAVGTGAVLETESQSRNGDRSDDQE